ncbi:head-tail connector protein [Pseudomonas syringae group genomosp. 3]|uniref:Gp7 n=1 Tax=Pseudomonas syringae pv. persicae TaxID=237306 RepID=A0AB38E9K5_9PSED|nr:head-tail connector protein [Pseudomonas syringae group genomosp. 3]SOQ06546.1 Gp7 [Pseudomonas syringae pv. persicae]SOQ06833.1 Gp7 [Pseudomonas syringae pv. persicae]
MSVIDIELAMNHLLAESADRPLIQAQLDGAEDSAMRFLQRRFFSDQSELDLAKAGIKDRLRTSRDAFKVAKEAAALVDDEGDRCRLLAHAESDLCGAIDDIEMDAYGTIINPSIHAACLLTLGSLYANREDVVIGTTAIELPNGAKCLLMPYRIRMGA